MKRVGSVLTLGLAYSYACACCSVSKSGVPVHFKDQSDIVIWNPDTKTEHFVRIAHFQSEAQKFGFIAPTPSIPQLELVSPKAFGRLASLRPPSMGCSAEAAKKGGVSVVKTQDLGVYHTQTLESKDSTALAEYIKQQGFDMDEAVKEWVRHYVDKGWYLTIFNVGENADSVRAMDAIRMTFKTEEPFCPFYVPESNLPLSDQGSLQVFFVSNGSYSASLGNGKEFRKMNWHATLESDKAKVLAKDLKIAESDVPAGSVVSTLTYYGFPNGDKDDLFFRRDLIQGYMINGSVIGIMGFLGIWGGMKLVRRVRKKALGIR